MRYLAAAAAAALLILSACGGGSDPPAPTALPSPTAAATATPSATSGLGPAEFDPALAFAHVEALTESPRPAGSEAERDAARYLRDQLSSFGYEVQVEPFSFALFADAGSSLTVTSPRALRPAVYPFEPNLNAVAEGPLVAAGLGIEGDFPASTAGAIALIERGELRFETKVANAAAAGAIGAVIYNNEPGLYGGEFSGPPDIPALSMSQDDGQELLDLLEAGPVNVRLEVKTESGPRQSQNVVARPPDGECRVLTGGHYDSVAAGPGANDNASGTATVVEMARVMAADGEYGDVCFALFGSEEVGLVGSFRYVETMTDEERLALTAMLNVDMAGVGTRWLLAGTSSVADVAAAEAEARGLDYELSVGEELGGSDHAPFLQEGVPAIFLHSFTETVADDPNYHTAEDKPEHVRATRLAEIGSLAVAVIETLLAGG
jgi:aminopeptidase YwaD